MALEKVRLWRETLWRSLAEWCGSGLKIVGGPLAKCHDSDVQKKVGPSQTGAILLENRRGAPSYLMRFRRESRRGTLGKMVRLVRENQTGRGTLAEWYGSEVKIIEGDPW